MSSAPRVPQVTALSQINQRSVDNMSLLAGQREQMGSRVIKEAAGVVNLLSHLLLTGTSETAAAISARAA